MTDISQWEPVDGDNNAAPPAGAPENGTLISDLNDVQRATFGAVRRWYESPEFRDMNHAVQTSGSTTAIVLVGDVSALYAVGDSIRWTDQSGQVTGRVTGVSVATDTTITVNKPVSPQVISVEAGSPYPAYVTGPVGNLVDFDADGEINDSGVPIAGAGSDLTTNDEVIRSQDILTAITAGLTGKIPDVDQVDRSAQGHIIFRVSASTGLMIQWGLDPTVNGDSFSPTFTGTPYSLVVTPKNSSGVTNSAGAITSLTSNGFNYAAAGNPQDIFWIAIGSFNL